MNNTRQETGWGGRSGQNSVYVAGGVSPITGKTELWNGSTWTEVNDLSTGRDAMGSSGTINSGWVAGGTGGSASPGPAYQGTEEWSASPTNIKTVTTS